jgi:hypothetical protein
MKEQAHMPHNFEGTSHTRQLGSIQDFVTSGFNKQTGVYYTVLGDGHGVGWVVMQARKYKGWCALGELPHVDIQTLIQPFVDMTSVPSTVGDGMTLMIVRCIPDSVSGDTIVQVAWIGDSFAYIAQTSGPRHHTQHLFFNDEYEIHPSHQGRVFTEPVTTFRITSDTEMCIKNDMYFTFHKDNWLAETVNMTGALGHGGATVHPLFQKSFTLSGNHAYIIRSGSDGCWDMMHGGDWNTLHDPNVTSEEVTALAEKRWRKMDWSYDPTPPGQCPRDVVQLRNGLGDPDDIAVATIIIYPEPRHIALVSRRQFGRVETILPRSP